MRLILTLLACLWAAPVFAQYPVVPCSPGAGTWVFTSVSRLYVCAPDGLSWASDVSQYLVTVQALSDLPAPVSGVITLADNTTYQVTGEVDLGTNRIVWGARSGLVGTNRVNDRLVYTGTGTMFTIASGAVVGFFQEIGLRAPNGTLLDVSGVSLAMIDVTFGTIGTGGTIAASGSFSFSIRASSMVNAFTTTGFTFTGTTTSALRVFDNLARGNVGTLLNLGTASFGVIDIGRNIVDTSVGQTFMSGTTGGANVTSAGLLVSNAFTGAGTGVTTVTGTDTGWTWTANAGVTNTPSVGVAAWGTITGLLSAQVDLQTALNGKQASGTYASGTGSANGTNTGDQTSIVGITGSLAEFNTALTGADFATGGGTVTGASSGTNTGDQTSVTGNAGTATTLQNARTINGVSFNGSANITVTAAAETLTGSALPALSGAALTALDASDLASGTVPTARLGSGTANSATFLRGDSTWATPAGGSGPTIVRLSGNIANSTTAFADVTGLSWAVVSGTTYVFQCPMSYTTAISTTALQLSVNGPAMTALDYTVLTSTTATAMHSAAQTAVDTNTNPATGGGATRLPVNVSGSFVPSANGTFALRLRSEIAASAATVMRGSFCVVS